MKKFKIQIFGLLLVCLFAFSCKKTDTIAPSANPSGASQKKVAAVPSGSGTTYYVSPTGNDSNNGTSTSTPWKTIAKVNSKTFNPGDQILFKGGQTFAGMIQPASSGSSTAYIRFASYGGGRATINGGTNCGVYVYDKSNVWVDSLVVTGTWNATTQTGNTSYGILFYNDLGGGTKLGNAKVTHCDVSGFYKIGINFYSYTGDGTQSGYSSINASYNNVHDNGLGGIESNGPWPPAAGSSSYAFTTVYAGYNTVYNNLGLKSGYNNHSGDGIVFSDCGGGIIEHNVAYNNGWYSTGGGPAAIWCWDSTGLTFQYNEAYGNGSGAGGDGDGFDLDGGATYCTLQYNYSHDNTGAGFLVYEFGDPRGTNSHNTVRYNISQNDGSFTYYGSITQGGGAHDNTYYNNTLYNKNGSCVKIYDGSANYCYNNIFYCANNGADIVWTSTNTAWFLNNEYYNSVGPFRINFNGTVYTSLSSFQASGWSESWNGNIYGYAVNPSLNNPGNAGTVGTQNPNTLTNYKLNSGSLMASNGFNLTSWGISVGNTDFNGTSIPYSGGKYNIGACN